MIYSVRRGKPLVLKSDFMRRAIYTTPLSCRVQVRIFRTEAEISPGDGYAFCKALFKMDLWTRRSLGSLSSLGMTRVFLLRRAAYQYPNYATFCLTPHIPWLVVAARQTTGSKKWLYAPRHIHHAPVMSSVGSCFSNRNCAAVIPWEDFSPLSRYEFFIGMTFGNPLLK